MQASSQALSQSAVWNQPPDAAPTFGTTMRPVLFVSLEVSTFSKIRVVLSSSNEGPILGAPASEGPLCASAACPWSMATAACARGPVFCRLAWGCGSRC